MVRGKDSGRNIRQAHSMSLAWAFAKSGPIRQSSEDGVLRFDHIMWALLAGIDGHANCEN